MATTTVAKYLAATLPRLGVSHVFELVGGMVTVLLDAMHASPDLTVVSMHHEQGAGFAAEGFSRTAGRPALALATSGPGATNLLTAIGSCYFDSIPVVFITGQVNRHELGAGQIGRQGGFQELDIVSMASPITKMAVRVMNVSEFPAVLDDAFSAARSGRPGPVLIDLPMDVQQSPLPSDAGQIPLAIRSRSVDRAAFLETLQSSLSRARRPLALVGGGVRSSGATGLLDELLAVWPVPVVNSLMGVDAVPGSHPCRVGLIGSYGNRWANATVAEADVLLVLGSRLDIRQTGSDVPGFIGNRTIFHVDIDSSELNTRVAGCLALEDDLRSFLKDAVLAARDWVPVSSEWKHSIAEMRAMWPDTSENVPNQGINPNIAVREVCAAWPDMSGIVTDVGQHQMWAAQSVQLRSGQRFLTSGGMGSMGFGLPAAIGAALATPDKPLCLITGDGGLQCNIQELQTLVRLALPVRIMVFDNGCHGMVRQFQQAYFDSRYFSTAWGYSAPDFAAVAKAYGIEALTVASHQELAHALESTAGKMKPVLIRVVIEQELNAYPKMAFGQPFGSMEPTVKSVAMEGT